MTTARKAEAARALNIGVTGVAYYPGFLSSGGQAAMLRDVLKVIRAAPFFTPRMPRTGKAFSVRMTNAGPLGWLSDREGGYRYEPRHPETGQPWPPIPESVLKVWRTVSGYGAPPEACLVNYYTPGARMGLHRDSDEAALDAPVVSISLGDTAVFRIGGPARSDKTRSLNLHSGDVVAFGGPARLAYHGIDRVLGGTSRLLPDDTFPEGGRINLTLRRVNGSRRS
jgi:alkylated DNA repair protein (DNA oxidative demethylase)